MTKKSQRQKALPYLGRIAFILLVLGILNGCESSSIWLPPTSGEGTVWQSTSGNWRAEVDVARGRLTYLGPLQGPNFLNSPAVPENNLELGGHRVWLGPQTDWKPFWPPPANWEMLGAAKAGLVGEDVLEIESKEGPGAKVAIRRTYRWLREGLLECSISWKEDNPQGRQAIQIFQVRDGAVFEALREPSAEVPEGYVRLPLGTRPTMERTFPRPAQVRVSGEYVYLQRKPTEDKLGFTTQTLCARWPEGRLLLHPGKVSGRKSSDPDLGYHSQIYLGGDDVPDIEMEQVTSRLIPTNPGERVGQTVTIELLAP